MITGPFAKVCDNSVSLIEDPVEVKMGSLKDATVFMVKDTIDGFLSSISANITNYNNVHDFVEKNQNAVVEFIDAAVWSFSDGENTIVVPFCKRIMSDRFGIIENGSRMELSDKKIRQNGAYIGDISKHLKSANYMGMFGKNGSTVTFVCTTAWLGFANIHKEMNVSKSKRMRAN